MKARSWVLPLISICPRVRSGTIRFWRRNSPLQGWYLSLYCKFCLSACACCPLSRLATKKATVAAGSLAAAVCSWSGGLPLLLRRLRAQAFPELPEVWRGELPALCPRNVPPMDPAYQWVHFFWHSFSPEERQWPALHLQALPLSVLKLLKHSGKGGCKLGAYL